MPELNFVSTSAALDPDGANGQIQQPFTQVARPGYNYGGANVPAADGFMEFGSGTPGSLPFRVDQDGNITAAGINQPGGLKPSGGDDTAAINDLLATTGLAQLALGTFNVSNILLDTNQVLSGSGLGTVLKAIPGTAGAMVSLKTPATSNNTTVRDLTLMPDTGTLHGISLDNTGISAAVTNFHLIFNVVIQSPGGDGIRLTAVQGVTGFNIQCANTGGVGYNLLGSAASNSFTQCSSGPTGDHGWVIAGQDNLIMGCTAFFAGFDGSSFNTTSNGFYCGDNSGSSFNRLIGCHAQNAALNGIMLDSAAFTTVTGCEVDGNNKGGSGGAGIDVNFATNCVITGNVGGNQASDPQQYGIAISGTCTGTRISGNNIHGTSQDIIIGGGTGFTLNQPVSQGTGTLSGGTVTVDDAAISDTSIVLLSVSTPGGTQGALFISAISAGVSFTVKSTSGSDASVFTYQIIETG